MSDAGPGSHDLTRFPPGSPAPTATTRADERAARLRDPAHLDRLNAGLAAFRAKPKEERDRITAERKAAREAKDAARAARRAAKEGPVAPPPDSAPPTARSQHSTELPPSPAPHLDVPRRGATGGALRGLLDLVQVMPDLGDGTCFIQVERKKPVVAFSQNCGGVQRHIWDPMDDAVFATVYGGGEYSLRGYRLTDDNRARALTEPVTYKVAGAPVVEAMITEEDTTMRPNGSGHGHPVTALPLRGRPQIVTPQGAAAEAQIHDRSLEHQEIMDEREERRRLAAREERRTSEQAVRQEQTSVARILADSKDKEAERLRQAYESQLESRGGGLAEMAELLKVIKPGDDTAALSRQHAAEIKSLTEGHRQEMVRQSEQHRLEITRLIDTNAAALQRVEDHAREERTRADTLVRESERRSNETIREAQRAADQRVTDAQNSARTTYEDLKARSEERLKDQNDQWTRRFEDQRDNHARELKRKDDEIVLMRTGLQGNMDVILAGKDNEIRRLQHDLRAAKEEAENNKDWEGQLEKFEKRAETLGYAKGGGEGEEEDFKTTIAKAAIGQLHKLPDMIKSGADAIAAIRNPGVPPDVARSQARAASVRASGRTLPRTMAGPNPVQLHAPLTFATEDTEYVPPAGEIPSMPRFPAQQVPFLDPPPMQQPDPGYYQQQPQMPVQQQTALPPEGPPALVAAPEAAAQAPVQPAGPPASAAAPAATAPAPSPAGIDPGVVATITEWAPNLAAAFNQSAAPEEVANAILEQAKGAPPEMVRGMFESIKIDQVIMFIVQNPGEHGVLATRNGQKFLRAIWNHIDKTINAEPAV